MIDISREQLIPLSAGRTLPGQPSPATLWRWRTRGVRGRKLESVVLGGRVYTSVEALQRFAQQQGGTAAPQLRTPRQRDRAIERAEAEVKLLRRGSNQNSRPPPATPDAREV